jgi:hypothetical protein
MSFLAVGFQIAQILHADLDVGTLDQIIILGRRQNLVGQAATASQGTIGSEQLRQRPLLRSGDLIEFVPGMVATQHSGSGKASQYFLRGFNLDHGTDFASFVDDMPVNLRTHGHGQGYTDLNFVIPEMVGELKYEKGPYAVEIGDFSASGSAHFRLADDLAGTKAELRTGAFGFLRGVAVGSADIAGTQLNYGAESHRYAGPWDQINEDVAKKNVALKFTRSIGDGSGRLLLMGYDNTWNSPDQIPQRAVGQGLISRFGSLDTTLGGESSRYSLSAGYSGALAGGVFDASVYGVDYDLTLYSNFTYLLDDPTQGDQFSQFDHRKIYGAALSNVWFGQTTGGNAWKLRVGSDLRTDLIAAVGLNQTRERRVIESTRNDQVREASFGVYIDGEYKFNPRWRTYFGTRVDHYDFNVTGLNCSFQAASCTNSGSRKASISSPKGSLIYTAGKPLELYLSYGKGFHSNDARGTTAAVDPRSNDAIAPVTPLVASIGSELGARVFVNDRLNASLALWRLTIDSELLFVGDAGNTEASRPSKRQGAELGVYWFPSDIWNVEFEASYTNSKFRGFDAVGNKIPGSIPLIISAGINAEFDGGYSATARIRHFGRYPLIEDNSVKSNGSTLVNLRFAKRWDTLSLSADLLNVFDSKAHDIDYFYASRLAGEPVAGVDDIHFHSFEPRALRLSLGYQW